MSFDLLHRWIVEVFIIVSALLAMGEFLRWQLGRFVPPKGPLALPERPARLPGKPPRKCRRAMERLCGARQKRGCGKKRSPKGPRCVRGGGPPLAARPLRTARGEEGRSELGPGVSAPGRIAHHRDPAALVARNAWGLCGGSNTGGRRNGKPRKVEFVLSPLDGRGVQPAGCSDPQARFARSIRE